jgi:hypothetical protein
MVEITLPSGRSATINCASLSEALDLKEAIFRSITAAGKFFGQDASVAQIITVALCSIESSREVRDALFKCFARCLIDKEKITPQSIEDNFQDYSAIAIEVIAMNFLPFMEGLSASVERLKPQLTQAVDINSPKT